MPGRLLACGIEHSTISARPAWPVPSPDADFVPVGPWNTDGLIVVNPLLSEARSHYIQALVAAEHPVVLVTTWGNGPLVAVDGVPAKCKYPLFCRKSSMAVFHR